MTLEAADVQQDGQAKTALCVRTGNVSGRLQRGKSGPHFSVFLACAEVSVTPLCQRLMFNGVVLRCQLRWFDSINCVLRLLCGYAGACDTNVGFCFCNNGTYARIHDDRGMPFSALPGQQGRPISWHMQPGKSLHDPSGKLKRVYAGVRERLLWGSDRGWCTSANPKQTAPCHLENLGGALCDEPIESTCVNQCGGHGTCHLGFCLCDAGWCAS